MTETLLLEVADPYQQLRRLIMKKEVSALHGMPRRRVLLFFGLVVCKSGKCTCVLLLRVARTNKGGR